MNEMDDHWMDGIQCGKHVKNADRLVICEGWHCTRMWITLA
jgi:hypothetical protein